MSFVRVLKSGGRWLSEPIMLKMRRKPGRFATLLYPVYYNVADLPLSIVLQEKQKRGINGHNLLLVVKMGTVLERTGG
jgi:hypothetical protein